MTRRIKILYLHNTSEISGGERSLLNLWRNLDFHSFEPLVVLPQEGPLSLAAQDLGVKIEILDVPKIYPINFFSILRVKHLLRAIITRQNIDLVHSYSPRNNILSVWACRGLNVPVIWHERNLTFGDEKDVSLQFYAIAQQIVCNSRAVAARFSAQKDSASKVKVVLNGVDLNYLRPDTDHGVKRKLGIKDERVIGMTTNLNKRKRIEFLLQAIPLIGEKFSNVKFLIIGGEFPFSGGAQLRDLEGVADRLGVRKDVIFTGFQDDVRPFVNILDVFVHVTLKEACSRAILEAMAMAKPVIAINDGGNPELVDHQKTGILIEPDDLHGFAYHVIELLNDDVKRASMGAQGRRRCEELFDVKRNARETENIYRDLLAGKPSFKDN